MPPLFNLNLLSPTMETLTCQILVLRLLALGGMLEGEAMAKLSLTPPILQDFYGSSSAILDHLKVFLDAVLEADSLTEVQFVDLMNSHGITPVDLLAGLVLHLPSDL